MYLSFFNFTCKPFELIPNPGFMFLSRTHKKAISYLDYGIRERVGFVLLTGEVGSGKTTIIRELINKHLDQVVLAKVFNTNANSEELLAMINDDFNLPVQGKDRITLLRDLNHFLVEQYAKGTRPLLIIDEAQNLSPETLEEIRMLSNLETSDSKLLQIILVGQPELRSLLARPDLRQLRQRISFQCHLQPLNRQEVEEYINHRLEVAGNREAVSFTPVAFDIINTYSCGLPRLINIICDFLLLSAFAEGIQDISEEMIRDIIGELDFSNNYWPSEQPGMIQNRNAGGSATPSPSAPLPENRLEELFGALHQRLNEFEKNSAASTQKTLGEFNQRLTEVSREAATSHSAISELREQLTQIQLSLATHTSTSPSDAADVNQTAADHCDGKSTQRLLTINDLEQKPGLLRRIFS